MLASVNDYLHLWQLPIFLGFALLWLVGGTYLTSWALRRFSELPRSKRQMGRCTSINVVATGSGLAAVLVVSLFLYAMLLKYGYLPLIVSLVVLAPLVMLAMGWAVGLVMIPLPPGQVFRVSLRTSGVICLGMAIFGAAAAVPAWYQRQGELREQGCYGNVILIAEALRNYNDKNPGQQAPSLQTLVQSSAIPEKVLHCPGRSDKDVGYVYLNSFTRVNPEINTEKLVVADRAGNHSGRQQVVWANYRFGQVDRKYFQQLLTRPENKEFAKLWEAAE